MDSNRYSFDDRIDDDLLELILSYLPIVDKIRYESVSKRFQRFLFDKQRVLRVRDRREDSADVLNARHLLSKRTLNVSHLRRILQKFKFITKISFFCCDYLNRSQVLDTINDNCSHLTDIWIDLKDIESETINRFCHKFGHQLKRLNRGYSGSQEFKVLLQNSPNLWFINELKTKELNYEFLSKKLSKIYLVFRSKDFKTDPFLAPDLRLQSLKKFQNLEYLGLSVHDFFVDSDSFKELSELKNLKLLEIMDFLGAGNWDTIIEMIANNCHQLEYFSFESQDSYGCNPNHCIRCLSQISGLKRLRIHALEEEYMDITPLKNCKQLVSLNLFTFNDEILRGIDLIVPQLRQLTFRTEYKPTARVLESISNLKCLTHFDISFVVEITANVIQNIINGCKRLKYLSIEGYYAEEEEEERVRQLMAQNSNIQFKLRVSHY